MVVVLDGPVQFCGFRDVALAIICTSLDSGTLWNPEVLGFARALSVLIELGELEGLMSYPDREGRTGRCDTFVSVYVCTCIRHIIIHLAAPHPHISFDNFALVFLPNLTSPSPSMWWWIGQSIEGPPISCARIYNLPRVPAIKPQKSYTVWGRMGEEVG